MKRGKESTNGIWIDPSLVTAGADCSADTSWEMMISEYACDLAWWREVDEVASCSITSKNGTSVILDDVNTSSCTDNTAVLSSSSLYYTSAFTSTLHHSLLPFIIDYYPTAFTTKFPHSLLPFPIHLLFIIHYYTWAFNTTLHISRLPINLHYYSSSFTATHPHSLLPFLI